MEEHPKGFQLSLRAKAVALLAVPLAALFAALFAVYGIQQRSGIAEQALERGYAVRAELTVLRLAAARSSDPAARARLGQSQERLAVLVRGDALASERFSGVRHVLSDVVGGAPLAQLDEALDSLRSLEDQRFLAAQREFEAANLGVSRTLLICGLLGTLGTLLVHLLITGRLVSRLQIVGENARRVAHGEPVVHSALGTDEIADLGREVEHAADLLGEREREFRESERRYRDLFDQAPVPYQETDAQGMIRRVNHAACALLHSTAVQLIGRRAWDMISPGQQEAQRDAMLARIAEGRETDPFESELQLDDGAYLTVEVREKLIRNPRGEVTGTVRSLQDVTERNLATVAARKVAQYAMELRIRNEQLVHALDAARSATVAKSRFLASISHELRTPLNGIIGFSELLYDCKIGPISEDQRDVLSDILNSSRHLLRLINDVLDISKIEAGKMEFHPEPCALNDLIAEVRDVIRPLADRKHLTLTMEARTNVQVVMDGARFKQVVYNYLSNAVKFTPEGGRIVVRVLPQDNDRFRLEVEDTGIGVAEEEVPRLFQEFGQLGSGRSAEQGTGLGLALTRTLIEAQGGEVGVRSRPGKGSTFWAVLPMTPNAQVQRAN